MSLEEKFGKAAQGVRDLKKVTEDDKRELYSLYKQSIVGDVNTPKPGITDVVAKAKWDAWSGKKGLSQTEAKEKYIAKAESLGIQT